MKRRGVTIRVMKLSLLIRKITGEQTFETNSVKEKSMEEQLPNILIDGIPFILEPNWIIQWNSGGRVIYKEDMHDEGHFSWFMFSRCTLQMVKGMEQFNSSNDEMVRIILHADLFRRIDYYREYHHGGFDRESVAKKDNYQLLPDTVAIALVKELRHRNIPHNYPGLRDIIWQIIDQLPAEIKVQKRWTKQESKKNKGLRK